MKKIIPTLIIIALISIVGFIILKPTSNTSDPNKIKIGVSDLRISTPVFVAIEQGYFKDAGLDIEISHFDTAQPLMGALISDNIQAGGYIANPIILKGMEKSGKKFHIATSMVEDVEHPVSILLIDKDENIQSIADLKGKTIGILPTAAYRIWLEQILAKHGVSIKDVVVKNVAPSFTVTEFTNDGIDAAFTNDPAATAAVVAGVAAPFSDKSLIAENLWEPYYFGSFLVSESFKKDHPEQVAKLLTVLNRAIQYIEENPNGVQEVLRKSLPLEQSKLVAAFPKSKYHNTDQFSYDEFKKVMNNFVEFGFLKSEVDYSPWILK